MDIIMVPFHDYKKWIHEGFRTRDAHLFQHLQRNKNINKILIVNRPVSLAESIVKKKSWKTDIGTVIYKEKGFQIVKISEKVYCADFFIPDFLKVIYEKKRWWFSAFNNDRVLQSINKAINLIGLKKTVLLLQNPMAVGIAKKVDFDVFAFDAIDNWIYHPQMKGNKNLVINNYNFIDNQSDIIFTVSKDLKNIFKNSNNTYWIPNGVDIEYFSTAVKKHIEKDKITIGYVGKIQDRVNFDLIEKCLMELPDCQFNILGPIYSQHRKAKYLNKKFTNINFLGDIHYKNLPKEMSSLDVTIIPHKINEFTSSMNPLKLYEYLAAGKPVISTNVAGVKGISPYVYLAANDEEFIEKLKKTVNTYKKGDIVASYIQNSLSNQLTWEAKSEEIVNHLVNKLSEGKEYETKS